MNILYFLIACSILIALIFLSAFFWAMKDGQNDDMETPAMRILFEDDKPEDSWGFTVGQNKILNYCFQIFFVPNNDEHHTFY